MSPSDPTTPPTPEQAQAYDVQVGNYRCGCRLDATSAAHVAPGLVFPNTRLDMCLLHASAPTMRTLLQRVVQADDLSYAAERGSGPVVEEVQAIRTFLAKLDRLQG